MNVKELTYSKKKQVSLLENHYPAKSAFTKVLKDSTDRLMDQLTKQDLGDMKPDAEIEPTKPQLV